jgi:hypothetical protein
MGTKRHEERVLDVRKDRLDLRDREYRPILKSLPNSYPNNSNIEAIVSCYMDTGMILDQGSEGKCTGYALATVINYLLWRDNLKDRYSEFVACPIDFAIEKVSEHMLFNLARVYDEWDGEDYEGSSCRGAMKGWNRHGVCKESCWKIKQDEPDDDWAIEARERPLGAYYRVDSNSISDIQSAICEVGALYVSATIHDGWWKLKDYTGGSFRNIPIIEYEEFPRGGHAFVILGYTRDGFIIQNSWGKSWGVGGFAVLSYNDWLENGMDVWVAVMGVPIDIEIVPHSFSSLSLANRENEMVEGTEIMKKALSYSYTNRELEPKSEDVAYQHSLILNRHGRAKHTIIHTCRLDRSIDIICYDNIEKWTKKSSKNRKIALYALSGFCDEKESISKIRVLLPYFLKNGIYPIFLTWQTSSVNAIKKSIDDFCKEMRGVDREIKRSKYKKEALNRAIEEHCQKISTRSIWTEVKKKSLRANLSRIRELSIDGEDKQGVLYILTNSFQKLQEIYGDDFEIHAIAHSTGSQLIATTWLKELEERGMKLKSMHLQAPTLSLSDSNRYLIDAVESNIIEKEDIYIYMLDKEMELSSSVSEYGKSLLHLISRSLEKTHKTPLLGLEESWDTDNRYKRDGVFNTRQLEDIRRWQNFAFDPDGVISSIQVLGKESSLHRCSIDGDFIKLTHDNFDSSIYILESILKSILGKKLKYRVENLC